MAITRQKKEEVLNDIKEKLSRNKLVVFVDYRGVNVTNLENIRKELRKDGIDFKVVKKTLINLALKDNKINADVKSLEGQIGVVIGYNDEVTPAKTINKFAKELESFQILAGIFENNFVEKDKIIMLASIPSREELLAKFVGSINSPLSGMVNVLAGNIRGFVQVLNAISQK